MKNIQAHGKTNKLVSFAAYILIGFAAFFLYSHTISYDISGLDDDTFVKMSFTKTSITDVFTKTIFLNDISAFYRPVLSLSFMTDNLVSGGSPFAFHTTNVLIHVLSCLLILFFLKRYYFDYTLSFLLTLFFALHPVNTFAVAWIPGRNDPLLFIFFILSLIFFIEYLYNRKLYMLFLHFFSLITALLTKETAVLIPFVCAGYYFTFNKTLKSFFIKISVFWLALLGSFFVFHQSMSSHISPAGTFMRAALHSYKVIFDYYSSLYFFNIHFSSYTDISYVIIGIAALALSLVIILLSKLPLNEKLIYFFMPLSIMAISLFASQGFYQASRLYIPLFCIIIPLGTVISQIKNKRILYISISVLCIAAGFISAGKIKVFKNGLSFFAAIDSEKPNYNLNLSNLYSYHLLKNGYIGEASGKIKQIAQLTGYKSGYNLYLLSVIYIYERNYERAATILESILSFDEKDISVKLFICYNALNNKIKSAYYYNKLIALTGSVETADILIEKQEGNLENVQI